MFPLPLSHAERIRQTDGVQQISWANWFGAIYKEPKNFFPQFAIQAESYLDLYPEYVIPEADKAAFLKDRRGAVIGRKIAQTHGLQVGDQMTLKGTIYPGNWEFQVRGIYDGRDPSTDAAQMFFTGNISMKKPSAGHCHGLPTPRACSLRRSPSRRVLQRSAWPLMHFLKILPLKH